MLCKYFFLHLCTKFCFWNEGHTYLYFKGRRRRKRHKLGRSVPVYPPGPTEPVKLHFSKGTTSTHSPYMMVQKLPVIKVHILNHGQWGAMYLTNLCRKNKGTKTFYTKHVLLKTPTPSQKLCTKLGCDLCYHLSSFYSCIALYACYYSGYNDNKSNQYTLWYHEI